MAWLKNMGSDPGEKNSEDMKQLRNKTINLMIKSESKTSQISAKKRMVRQLIKISPRMCRQKKHAEVVI